MASIWRDRRSGKGIITFLYVQQAFTRSLRTASESKASRSKALIKDTLHLLQTGRLEIPADVEDEGTWMLTGGKVAAQTVKPSLRIETVSDVCDKYLGDQIDKHKATRKCDEIHIAHLKRILGPKTMFRSLSLDDMRQAAVRQ